MSDANDVGYLSGLVWEDSRISMAKLIEAEWRIYASVN